MPLCFVTGGSGFVGRHLIQALRRDGHPVRALARSPRAEAAVRAAGAEPVPGDLLDRAALRRGLSGCGWVFHCAAEVDEWGDPARYWQINVEGTQALLDAAAGAPGLRLVHVSTEAVYADGGPMADLDERRPLPARPLPRYARTKGEAERRVLAAVAGGLDALIVRPRLVWGRDDSSVLPKLVQGVREGRFAWVEQGAYLTSTTHIDNLVEGLLKAAERGQRGEAYFLSDGDPVEFRAFFTALLATQGVTAPDRSVSRATAWRFAQLCEWLWDHLPLRGRPPLSRLVIALGGQTVTVNDAKARRALGYQGRVTREEGLAGIVRGPA
ncbi:MAG TPA: NAD-dependent epimerase/dehydratase family protein [Nevskiaceae bacterium]|nr:NAD-dependent epimerase/dehydratase family protein [Nevskiaceae bacterium]